MEQQFKLILPEQSILTGEDFLKLKRDPIEKLQKKLESNTKAFTVYINLLYYYNKEADVCEITHRDLAKISGLSVPSVSHAINFLIEKGLIEKVKKGSIDFWKTNFVSCYFTAYHGNAYKILPID